jgi:hypothetical protein
MRIMSNSRHNDALSSREANAGVHRGSSTVPQLLAVAVLAVAHFLDWATFLVLVGRHGITAEANPIVRSIAQSSGVPGLTLAKIATVSFAALLMLLIAPKRPKLAYGLLLFGIAAGVVGAASNVTSL